MGTAGGIPPRCWQCVPTSHAAAQRSPPAAAAAHPAWRGLLASLPPGFFRGETREIGGTAARPPGLCAAQPGTGARSGGVEPHRGPPKNSPELPGAQRSAQSPAGIPEPPTAARMETVGPNLAPPRSPPAPSPSSARRDASGSSGRHRAVRRHEALRGIFSSAGRA